MIIFPHNLHFHFVQKQIIEGCGWYGVVWSFENCEIILVFAYFKCGEGVQGPTNSQLWAGLMSFVTSVHKPVIVAGDFNLDPGAFMTTTMAQVMQVQVLATGEAACNTGSEIDWALISTSLAADVVVQSNWIVPFKPHAMLQFKIAGHFQDLTVRQLSKFGPAPQLKNPAYEWHQIDERDAEVQRLNRQTDPLTQQAGNLCSRIERYVLQQLDTPTLGRGVTLQFVQRPLHDASKPWLWERGSLGRSKFASNSLFKRRTANRGIKATSKNWVGTLRHIGVRTPRPRVMDSKTCLRCFGTTTVQTTSMCCSMRSKTKESYIRPLVLRSRPKNTGSG